MTSRIVQLDMFASAKEAFSLEKSQKEKSFDKRLGHLFGRIADAESMIEDQRAQIEQLWQLLIEFNQRKSPLSY